MRLNQRVVNVEDVRSAAKRRLPAMIFDFLDGGALDEVTLRSNASDLGSLLLRQRVMQNISRCDMSATVLGRRVEVPVMVAPMGGLTIFHPDADVAIAEVVRREGSILAHSMWSGVSLDEVTSAAPGAIWEQVALWVDDDFTNAYIERARRRGVDVLVVAGDVAVSSKRERDLHHGLGLPPKLRLRSMLDTAAHPRWLYRYVTGRKLTFAGHHMPHDAPSMQALGEFMHACHSESRDWGDLARLRARWPGRLVLKGVMTPEDTRLAVDAGVDGVIVSNHGGRQFDSQPSTIAALPGVVEAAGGRCEVYLDGGIRRGADVAKAIALGARAVMIGRPAAYGLAAGGQGGVARVFEVLRHELRVAMGFVGATSLAALGPDVLWAPLERSRAPHGPAHGGVLIDA